MKELLQSVREQLQAANYAEVRSQWPEIMVFVDRGSSRCICLADDRNGFLRQFGEGIYRRLAEYAGSCALELRKRWGESQTEAPEALLAVICDGTAGTRMQMDEGVPCWLLDASGRRLIIYENQPGEFGNARECLERALAGKGTEAWKQYITPVNTGIVLVNLLVFILTELFGNTEEAYYIYQCGGIWVSGFLAHPEWYRLLTSAFLHFGLSHLINNMLVLLVTGAPLERLLGWKKYGLLYLLGAVGANGISLWWYWMQGEWNVVSAGASGAIFSVLGALLFIVLKNRGHVERISRNQLTLMIVFTLFHGVTSAGVNNSAHIGGLLIGFLFGALFYRRPEKKQ